MFIFFVIHREGNVYASFVSFTFFHLEIDTTCIKQTIVYIKLLVTM